MFVTSAKKKMWHYEESEKLICGASVEMKLWRRKLRRFDLMCPKCKSLMYKRDSPLHDEAEGQEKLRAWAEKARTSNLPMPRK